MQRVCNKIQDSYGYFIAVICLNWNKINLLICVIQITLPYKIFYVRMCFNYICVILLKLEGNFMDLNTLR